MQHCSIPGLKLGGKDRFAWLRPLVLWIPPPFTTFSQNCYVLPVLQLVHCRQSASGVCDVQTQANWTIWKEDNLHWPLVLKIFCWIRVLLWANGLLLWDAELGFVACSLKMRKSQKFLLESVPLVFKRCVPNTTLWLCLE